MKKILLILILVICASCSKKKENTDELKAKREKWKKESLKETNKDFQYLSLIVASKTGISKDTTDLILKHYYELNNLGKFKENSFIIIEDNLSYKTIPHKLDVMNKIAKKLNNDIKKVYSCYDEIEMHREIKKNTENIEDLYYQSSNIEEMLDEVLESK